TKLRGTGQMNSPAPADLGWERSRNCGTCSEVAARNETTRNPYFETGGMPSTPGTKHGTKHGQNARQIGPRTRAAKVLKMSLKRGLTPTPESNSSSISRRCEPY